MITAFTYCGKFENFTFCIEPLSLHFIVTLPVFNVLSIFPIVPVENVEPPNNANGAYDMSLHPSLFIEIVTDFISAPEVLYINKLLKTFLLFYREPITLTFLSIVISLQLPHAIRSTDTVLSLEFKDGITAPALFKIFATPDIFPNAKIFMYLL